jgi:hypothetical protein
MPGSGSRPFRRPPQARDILGRSGDHEIVPQPVGLRRCQRVPAPHETSAALRASLGGRLGHRQRSSSLVGLAATVFARLR